MDWHTNQPPKSAIVANQPVTLRPDDEQQHELCQRVVRLTAVYLHRERLLPAYRQGDFSEYADLLLHSALASRKLLTCDFSISCSLTPTQDFA